MTSGIFINIISENGFNISIFYQHFQISKKLPIKNWIHFPWILAHCNYYNEKHVIWLIRGAFKIILTNTILCYKILLLSREKTFIECLNIKSERKAYFVRNSCFKTEQFSIESKRKCIFLYRLAWTHFAVIQEKMIYISWCQI